MMARLRIVAVALALGIGAVAAPAALAQSRREQARLERADHEQCRRDRKKAGNKGTVIGAAGAGGIAAIAGGNVGESLLAAGVGAVAGNAIGKSGKKCDELYRKYNR